MFNKKLFVIVLLMILLVAPIISAFDFDNIKSFTKDETTSKYGKIEVYNSFLIPGLIKGEKLWKAELINNTDICGDTCSATKEIVLYKAGALIDNIKFENLYGNEIFIKSYSFYILKDGKRISYEIGEKVKAGTYLILLEGQKKPLETIDWKIYSNGKWTDEWAVWGGSNNYLVYDGVDFGDVTSWSVNTSNGTYVPYATSEARYNMSTIMNREGIASYPYIYNITYDYHGIVGFGCGFAAYWQYSDDTTDSVNGDSTSYNTYSAPEIGNPVTIANPNPEKTVTNITLTPYLLEQSDACYLRNPHFDMYFESGNVTLNYPDDNFATNDSFTEFNCSVVSSLGATLVNMSLVTNKTGTFNVDNTTEILGISNSSSFTLNFDDGTYLWNCLACDSDGTCGIASSNRTVTKDTSFPQINIISPSSLENYGYVGQNTSLNWSISDLSIQTCSYNYNGTNYTVDCNGKNTTFILESKNTNLTFYANDSLGHENSTSFNWTYKIFQNNATYNNLTTEGSTESFTLNFTKYSTVQISSISLIYNNTEYSSTYSISGNEVTGANTISIPNMNAITSPGFYWSILTSDDEVINTTTYNQTINILQVDNCSAYKTLIYNYTLYDEENKTKLSNTTIELQLNLYDSTRDNLILNFSKSYDNVNPAQICFNNTLLTTVNYSADSVVRYTSNNTHAEEYYNILNDVLTNSTVPNHIDLYDLLLEDSTEFQLTFRDSDLILSPNIIVYVYRQYVADNDFKVVEAPLTDSNGQTVLHLVRNNAVYNFIMKDINGEVVGTFNKVIAFCQDYTIGSCSIILNAEGTTEQFYNYLEDVGISYSSSYSNNTDLLSFNFVSDEGDSKTVNIKATRGGDFGNRTVCDESLTSASGIITCNTSSISATDKYLYLDIYVDGGLKASEIVDLEADTFNWGVNGSLFAFLLILALILMFNEDKQLLVLGIVIGWIVSVAMGFISGAVIGIGASSMWLIVTGIIIIWKLKKEEYG